MEFETKFNRLFASKPIIGMIHLAGDNKEEKIKKALEELSIYEKEGVDGAIIEDYHGEMYDVYDTLKEAKKQNFKIILGANVLRNLYLGLNWADEFGAKFVQFDSVQSNSISPRYHKIMKEKYSNILILGGIRFKYTTPSENSLEKDLKDGMSRCGAIVTTGEGTGIETPTEKLRIFKSYLGNFPLIVGAGLNIKNAYEQLKIADGAIVGSAFKPYKNTRLPVDKYLIRELMDIVKGVRKNGI